MASSPLLLTNEDFQRDRVKNANAQIWFFFGKPLNIYGNAHRLETRVSMPLQIIHVHIYIYILAWCNRIPRHRVFPTTRRILEASLDAILCLSLYIYTVREIKQIVARTTSFGAPRLDEGTRNILVTVGNKWNENDDESRWLNGSGVRKGDRIAL